MAIIPAFQADDAGSIPVARSEKIINSRLVLEFMIFRGLGIEQTEAPAFRASEEL